MKFQLWSRDEHGTTSIVGTFPNPDRAAKQAMDLVTQANFSNALSSSEQMRNIEAYFVEMDKSSYYSGNRPDGKHRFINDTGESSLIGNSSLKIYVGSKFEKIANSTEKKESKIYLVDHKKKEVNTLDHELLKDKTIYFIRPA
jgi:hypothetical protein